MASQRGSVNIPLYQRESLLLVSLAIIVFLIYSNSLQAPFVFDDLLHIKENPHIRLTQLSLEGISRAVFESHYSSRPIANISFANLGDIW